MNKKNRLLLKTKNDIPFIEGRVSIHQPTINEISLIDEENFHVGIRFLAFNKNEAQEDNLDLENMSDFDILLAIIQDKSGLQFKMKVTMVLTLLFPNFQVFYEKDKILLKNDKETKEINNRNFPAFKEIIINMFCLEEEAKSKYNPKDGRAKKIAEKLEKAKKRVNKTKGKSEENVSIYEYYISVLSVGENKLWNDLLEYTVPQLTDEFKRFERKITYDNYAAAAMAGAQGLDEVTHWMVDE